MKTCGKTVGPDARATRTINAHDQNVILGKGRVLAHLGRAGAIVRAQGGPIRLPARCVSSKEKTNKCGKISDGLISAFDEGKGQ
jgi:hypothetical protein